MSMYVVLRGNWCCTELYIDIDCIHVCVIAGRKDEARTHAARPHPETELNEAMTSSCDELKMQL